MSKKLIAKVGYNLEVTSWENDGDNYKTNTVNYSNKEFAIAVQNMCQTLFRSKNNGDGGVGNSIEGDYSNDLIIEFFEANKLLQIGVDMDDEDAIIDACFNYGYELLGSSEYYDFRVCSSAELYYVDENIYAEIIE